MKSMKLSPQLRVGFYKAAIILVPSYTVAFLTEMMVYVVPTLAAAGFVASSAQFENPNTTRRLDEDSEGHDSEGNEYQQEIVDFDDDG
jgi:hypothetical protein